MIHLLATVSSHTQGPAEVETVELNLNPRPGISAEQFEPKWLALPSWSAGVVVGMFSRTTAGKC